MRDKGILLGSTGMTSVRVDKSLKIEYNVLTGQRIKIGLSFTSKEIDSTARNIQNYS